MADVFKLFGEIAIRDEEAQKAIANTTKRAGDASKSIKKSLEKISSATVEKSFKKIGAAAVKCGKVVASGLAVGAAAVGTLMKASIGEYADYEQFVGGIETLFKESQGKVMEYANSAYQTAGLSANEYMETVTSFSASLLQGLGGDTERAAEMANLAVTDMADNANKMGTDMSSIQNAYQGFAKQNYTMLDNLKIGYGGTQTEMARLINDSGVLGAAITITADTVNQVPFHKIVEAIHVIQDEMEITGTTAKEAADTISGSFSSFKATWRNLLVGLASNDQNIEQLFANFTNAGKTLAKNVISVLPSLIRNLKTLLASAAQFISTEWANTIWPQVQDFFRIQFGVELPNWEKIKAEFSEKIEAINSIIGPTIEKIGGVFSERVPTLLSEAFSQMSTWFEENQEEIKTFVNDTGDFIIANLNTILDFFQWILDNGDAANLILQGLGATILASLAAAHPYVTAILAVIAYITELKKLQGDLETSAEKIGISTEAEDVIPQFQESANTAQQKGISGLDMLKAYNQAKQAVEAEPAEIGAELSPDAGEVLQGALDTLSLEAVVKMIADYSGLTLGDGVGDVTHFGTSGHSFAKGLDYVPYDGFPAILHKREAVLTASQADAWRSGSMGGADVSRLETAISGLASMMQQVVANTGRGQTIVLDSGALVGQLAPQMDTRLGTIANRKGRRNS